MRNSEMIRALRKKGLTYRAISELCSCSHGSVHAEILAMKKEKAEKKKRDEEEKLQKISEEAALSNLGVPGTSQEQSNTNDSPQYTYYETVD